MIIKENFLCQWRLKVKSWNEKPGRVEDTVVHIPYETTEWRKDYMDDTLTSTSCHFRHALKELARVMNSKEEDIELLSMYRTE